MSKRLAMLVGVIAFLGINAGAQTICPSAPMGERYIVDGAEVTDRLTGLVWARCSVGQGWNGSTCTGMPSELTHEQALQHAAGRSGWRLPNRRELFSLADKRCVDPAIDRTAFPNTPSSWYWSSSPDVGDPRRARNVIFSQALVDYDYRHNASLHVRLVRASQ